MANEHELGIVEFILDLKKKRFLTLINSEKGRKKIINALPHFPDFNIKYKVEIPLQEHYPKLIEEYLREFGAKDECYLFSESRNLDGRYLALSEALLCVVGNNMGTIISCLPGKLIYYEGEDIGSRFIFVKRK